MQSQNALQQADIKDGEVREMLTVALVLFVYLHVASFRLISHQILSNSTDVMKVAGTDVQLFISLSTRTSLCKATRCVSKQRHKK